MIRTDGRPTICTRGALPEEQKARMEQAARDIAAAYATSLEQARLAVQRAMWPRGVAPELCDLAETLRSDHPALD